MTILWRARLKRALSPFSLPLFSFIYRILPTCLLLLVSTNALAAARFISLSVGTQTGSATYSTAGSVSYTVTGTATENGNGSCGPLSISGLPAGVTGSFSPTALSRKDAGLATSTLMLQTTAATLAVLGDSFTVSCVTSFGNATLTAIDGSLTVIRASQTITYTSTAPGSATVGGATYTPTATGGASGNSVTITVNASASSVCLISAGVVSFKGTGNCVLDANQAGDANYNAAPQKQQSFVVGKGSQTITYSWTGPGSATVGGATYAPTATGGASGNPVTITVDASASSVCSISAGVVSFMGAGSCVLDANQAGDANYNAAPQVQQSVPVNNPVPTTTSISPASKNIGDVGFSMTVNGANFVPNSVVQLAGSNRTTTYVSATQLTVAIVTADMTTAGTFNITVVNPAPGGGTSNAQTFTTTLLTVVSINCAVLCGPSNPTSAATVSWTVTFSTSVSGVSASAFSLAASGLSGAYIAAVTSSGATWTVTANSGIGAGTLGLNQTGPGSVVPTLSGTFTGQVYTISATPALAEYRMDQASWNGTAGEVVDSSGSGLNAVAVNSAGTTGGSNSEAITGSPGTCRYGVFDNGGTITKGYVLTPLPDLTTDFTVSAWIRTTDNTVGAQRILIDDQGSAPALGYGFSLAEGGTGKLRFYSRGIAPVILDSTYAIANNNWYFVAAVADVTNKKRTIYVFSASGTLLSSTTEAAWTGTWGTDGGPVSIGAETNASGELPAAHHFKGNIDEVRVYGKVLNQAALAAIATQTHPCSVFGPDHYELSLPTSSIACLPTTLRVTACADTGSPCTNRFAAASGTTATLAATAGSALGATTVTFGATGIASTTLSYPAAADGTAAAVTLSGEQIAATSPRQCCPNGTSCGAANSCSTTFNTAGFIFSNAIGGGAMPIPTQVAGTSSASYFLRAVKTLDDSSHTCGAALVGAKAVNFGYECNDPTSCSGSNLMSLNGGTATTIARNNDGGHANTTPVNMSFDAAGNAGFTLNYSDVGQAKLWVNTTVNSAVLTGSSNAFVVKPGGFVLSNFVRTSDGGVNPAAAGAAGGKFVKAGEGFSATVTATTSGGVATPNFGKEISPEGVTLTANLVLPSGGHTGVLSNSAVAGGIFNAGAATVSNLSWDEVGIMTLTPSVLSASYLGMGDVTGTTTGNIGRFYPDHFAISAATLTAACSASTPSTPFSYFGQDGFTTAFTLAAQNVANATTQNYTAAFAKLDLSGYANYGFSAMTLPTGAGLGGSATAPSGTWTNGVATVSAKHQIGRPTALTGETLITVSAAPTDGEVPAAATATAVGSATKLRYGRLKLQNIYGSEKLALAVPLQAQYWSGGFFINNADDSCTALSAPAPQTLAGAALPNGLPKLYFYPVVSGKNELLSTDAVPTLSSPLISGKSSLRFGAPLKRGWLDVILDVPNYLAYDWGNCSGQTGTTGLRDDLPCARATFGVFGAKSPVIYRRENY